MNSTTGARRQGNSKSHVWLTRFTVEGRGQFPYDMLRYDSCYPRTGIDAAKLVERGPRRIEMVMVDHYGHGPERQRWASFLWTVVSE